MEHPEIRQQKVEQQKRSTADRYTSFMGSWFAGSAAGWGVSKILTSLMWIALWIYAMRFIMNGLSN